MKSCASHNAAGAAAAHVSTSVESRRRRVLQSFWWWLLRHWPWLAANPERARFVYRLHYRLFREWYEAGGPCNVAEGAAQSADVAPVADEAMRQAMRAALLQTSDPLDAREFNEAIAAVERARGLGACAAVPSAWTIEVGPNMARWEWAEPLWRFARQVRVVAHDGAKIAPACDLLEELSRAITARLILRMPLECVSAEALRLAAKANVAALECVIGAGAIAQLKGAGRDGWQETLKRFRADAKSAVQFDVELSRRSLAILKEVGEFAKSVGAERIHLHYGRAALPAQVPDSLFFESDFGRAAISQFSQQAHAWGIEVVTPFGPPSLEPYSVVHLDAEGMAFSCGGFICSHGVIGSLEEFLQWWDSPAWCKFRYRVSRGEFVPECQLCGVVGTADKESVPYHLTAYDGGEPSQEYLDTVRVELDRIGEDQLARDRNARIRHYEHSRGFTRLASYPHRMYVEVTDECNLRCPMCTQTILQGERRRIPLELVRKLTPLMRYMDLIHFTGCGETFLHPQLLDMLRLVPHHLCAVRIITNGLLLDEHVCRELINLQLKDLWVSLDGTDAATFEKIRGSKLFRKVLENVRTLTRLKHELGSNRPEVALNFVAQRSNIEQLPDFIRLAKELGADAVNVGFLQVYTRNLLTESLYFYQDLADHFLKEARRAAEEVGIRLYLPGLFAEAHARKASLTESGASDEASSRKCVEPYGFVLVRAEGQLGPCCVNDARLGSLSEANFVELWNGPAYRDFRRRVSTPEQDFDCEHCMLEGYKDITEFEHHVKLFDEHYRPEQVDYHQLEAEVRAKIAEGVVAG